MRDRLIEIIADELGDINCAKLWATDIADRLLANGVIVPPCKVGQEVYTNVAMQGWYFRDSVRPYLAKIVFIGINNSEEMGGGFFNIAYENKGYMMQFKFSDIGKTVFLTKEQAEKALAEVANGNK